ILTKDISHVTMAAGWSAVLGSSILCGVLSAKNISLPKVFAIVLGVPAIFASVQLLPLWSKLISNSVELAEIMTEDLSESLSAMGYSPETIKTISEGVKSFYAVFIRLTPSLTLLAVIFQFSIGFWLFVKWLNRVGKSRFPSFIDWKMPFAVTPLIIIGVLMRLFGNEWMTLVADNLIVILAVFYSIAGIALLEFLMKKFRFGLFSRILIYLLLLVTHFVGFIFLALAGFVDGFFDWRRKYPLPLDYKNV
ncbi:MAG: DUF2232 domain-containing protein, partial [Candidatus Zixiibacteriota bacterium]